MFDVVRARMNCIVTGWHAQSLQAVRTKMNCFATGWHAQSLRWAWEPGGSTTSRPRASLGARDSGNCHTLSQHAKSFFVGALTLCLTFCSVACLTPATHAQTTLERGGTSAAVVRFSQIATRGTNFLLNSAQAANGSFSDASDPAITALCVTALLRHGRSPDDPAIAKSLKYLHTYVHPDGGIYAEGSFYQNYETCISLIAFSAANQDGRYEELLGNAQAFARQMQWDDGEGKGEADIEFGGGGYGRSKRPDLSNTQFLIEALRRQENEQNRVAISHALTFVSRCQNLEGPHNTTPFAAKNPDGGFYYTPAAGGNSQAGTTETGGLRSYGSMTYAGLKSMIYAGLKPDDPRVHAALGWIEKNYSLTENPGMGTSGLFYYYLTFAKALDALGENSLTDAQGSSHVWRAELITQLAATQRPDGSWVNPDERWLEGNASLVTAYALLALDHCRIEAPGAN